jgi:hypothetical protein
MQTTSEGAVYFGPLPTGTYTVAIGVPYGWSAAVTEIEIEVTCGKEAGVEFALVDDTPPLITVQDVVAEATGPDGALVTFEASAEDPGRGAVSVVCSPASGSLFALATTTVSCHAEDLAGNSASAAFSVTVVDTTAPSIACGPGVNPAGRPTTSANHNGFYIVSATDQVTTSLAIMLGGHVLKNGDAIKLTRAPGRDGLIEVNSMGKTPVRHFQVGSGTPVIVATDAAGNTARVACVM